MKKFIFPFFLENISKLNISSLDKNSISYCIALDILFSKFRNDSKITPNDLCHFLMFLKSIHYEEPQIYKDIIDKYILISNDINKYQLHIDFVNLLGESGKFNLDISHISNKIRAKTNKMSSVEKTKLFNSLVRLNNLDHKIINFFTYTNIEELLVEIDKSESYSTLLSLFRLKLAYPEIKLYDSKVKLYKNKIKITTNIINEKEISQKDDLTKNSHLLNFSIIRYLPMFNTLDKRTKTNV